MEFPYDRERAVREISISDPQMGEVIRQIGPCSLSLREVDEPFHALFRAIVYQQLSGKAAATIFGRVLDLFPAGRLEPKKVLATTDESLRGAGMSRAKVASVKDLALKTIEGVVPDRENLLAMPDDQILSRLTQVRGIGRWTVEMLLIFNLGRPDVLPSTDLGIRKGVQQVYGLKSLPLPKEVDVHGERWRPFRSVASWYLWRVVDGDDAEW